MMESVYLIFIALVPPLFIALYLYYRDKYVREPMKLLLKSFFLGWLIVIPIMAIHFLMAKFSVYSLLRVSASDSSLWKSFFEAFILASLIEEGFKYLAFKKGVWKSKYFDEYYDGILYGALISLGFAALENIFYVLDTGYETAVLRAFTAIPAHTFFGITMGFYFALAKFRPMKRKKYLWLAFIVPFILHGIYDIIVFEFQRLESKSDPLFLTLIISFWVFMICLFFWSRKHLKKLLKKDGLLLGTDSAE